MLRRKSKIFDYASRIVGEDRDIVAAFEQRLPEVERVKSSLNDDGDFHFSFGRKRASIPIWTEESIDSNRSRYVLRPFVMRACAATRSRCRSLG